MGDDYVLVGSVPCRLSIELHVDGRRVSDQQRVKAGWCIAGHEGTGGTSRKRMRTMSAEGREVIGPRYSYWDRAMLDTAMGYITRQGAKTRSDTDAEHRELAVLDEQRVGRRQECPGGKVMQRGDENGVPVWD
jgi:hypothetical protein